MSKELKESLKRKGWKNEEIKKAVDAIYSDDKKEKHIRYYKFGNQLVFWIAILLINAINILIAAAFVFIFALVNKTTSYFLASVIGLVIGYINSQILLDLEFLENRHHLISLIITASTSIVVFFSSALASQKLSKIVKNTNSINPFVVSGLFLLFFLTPYLLKQIKKQKE